MNPMWKKLLCSHILISEQQIFARRQQQQQQKQQQQEQKQQQQLNDCHRDQDANKLWQLLWIKRLRCRLNTMTITTTMTTISTKDMSEATWQQHRRQHQLRWHHHTNIINTINNNNDETGLRKKHPLHFRLKFLNQIEVFAICWLSPITSSSNSNRRDLNKLARPGNGKYLVPSTQKNSQQVHQNVILTRLEK